MSSTSMGLPAPIPPAPKPSPPGIRALFALRDVRRRWPFALRAAVCMGSPVLAGWAAGSTTAGLMGTIGAFTALYGSGRPYLNRALHLAVIAVSLALGVALGIQAAVVAWAGVVTVALIAMAATLLCDALAVGPPGAYMFTLACAAGTGMHAEHISPWHTGLLVLAGGAFAWLVHMSGALLWPRGPEKAAVRAAADAVAAFAAAAGTPRQDTARHWAALAIHESWAALVSYQPVDPAPTGTLGGLRELNRTLHLLFAQAMRAAAIGRPVPDGVVEEIRAVAERADDPPPPRTAVHPDTVPLGRPGPLESVRRALRRGSPQRLTVLRVGLAALLAGAVGAGLGLDHAYWAAAAAVLMLHQGFDWIRTVQRSLERLTGTWIGLGLAAIVLAAHPRAFGLALTVAALQFVIELTVVRNYALAVVFITPIALTVVSGGRPVPGLGGLLLARGVDTAIGCALALAVFALTARTPAAPRVPDAVTATLRGVDATVRHLASGAVTTPEARTARRDLQTRITALLQTYDAGAGGSSAARRTAAERMWPTVVATQRLAYRTLSACWAVEQVGGADDARAMARSLLPDDAEARLHTALDALSAAVRDGTSPPPLGELPEVLATEVVTLRDSLVADADVLTDGRPGSPR